MEGKVAGFRHYLVLSTYTARLGGSVTLKEERGVHGPFFRGRRPTGRRPAPKKMGIRDRAGKTGTGVLGWRT